MNQSARPRILRLLMLAMALVFASSTLVGCGDDASETAEGTEETDSPDAANEAEATSTTEAETTESTDDTESVESAASADGAFPRTVATDVGDVTIEARPEAIVSLSPTATEILFAIGAGDQVKAVDLYSNYPSEAPEGTLDGFTPDLEAILATEPDLVVTMGLAEDITAGLDEAGVAVITQAAAADLDGTYDQIAQLGEASDNIDGAAAVVAQMRTKVDEIVANLPESSDEVRVFHEIDDSFYTATSATFIGQVYATMGFSNIADSHDPDGFGYPLIDAETIITENPTMIVFTDQVPYSAEDIAARPGWDAIAAVQDDNLVEVDADISSRWGPRIVEFMAVIAERVPAETSSGS